MKKFFIPPISKSRKLKSQKQGLKMLSKMYYEKVVASGKKNSLQKQSLWLGF
jgi:hypothetical protein